jgi:hypothetical protein
MPPIPRVAYCEVSAVKPADMKMSVEKYMTCVFLKTKKLSEFSTRDR